MAEEETSRGCTARCANGRPCRAWAVRGSDPPRCAPHGGGKRPVGAPKGNQNAQIHGCYSRHNVAAQNNRIAASIAQLCRDHARLSAVLRDHPELTREQRDSLRRIRNLVNRLLRAILEQFKTE